MRAQTGQGKGGARRKTHDSRGSSNARVRSACSILTDNHHTTTFRCSPSSQPHLAPKAAPPPPSLTWPLRLLPLLPASPGRPLQRPQEAGVQRDGRLAVGERLLHAARHPAGRGAVAEAHGGSSAAGRVGEEEGGGGGRGGGGEGGGGHR